MKKQELILSITAFLISNLVLLVVLSFVRLNDRTTVILGWSLIVVQVLATIVFYLKKKITVAVVGSVWVVLSILIQVIPWTSFR